MIWYEWMHSVPYGIGKDLCATFQWELAYNCGLPGRPEEILLRYFLRYKSWCSDHHVSCFPRPWNLTFIGRGRTSKDFPVLGSAVKAAHVKVMCSFVCMLMVQFAKDDVYSQMRATCAWSYSRMHEIFDDSGDWLQPSQAEEVYRVGRAFLQSWAFLAADADSKKLALYKIRPKHHALDHILMDVRRYRLNIRCLHVFGEEDFLGKLSRIGKRCHRRTASARILERYLLYLMVRWKRRRCGRL